MKSFVLVSAICAMLLIAGPSVFATTHHVPSEYGSIQAGLDVSVSGDMVLVQPGTYFENIVWPQVNSIRLIAAGDTSNTFIDGNQVDRVITMSSDGIIDSMTVIQGFTIRNGDNLDFGGGIYCCLSSPTISNCCFSGNSSWYGGGICCENSNPTITNSSIVGNSVGYGIGGGIHCYSDSSPTINNCIIVGNSSDGEWGYGGGIACTYDSNPTINNCTISGNVTGGGGGGIFCDESNPTINNCTISGNSVQDWNSGDGGGILCWASNPTISSSTISGNSAYDWGGGIYCAWGSSTISNCTISGNSAGEGGGIFGENVDLTITNSTISENSAGWGGGISFWEFSFAIINNCTISGNEASHGGGICLNSWTADPTITNCAVTDNIGEGISGGGSPEISYSDFDSNSAGDFDLWDNPDLGVIVGVNANGDSCDVYSNIFLDPLYVDPDNGDFHLQEGSPCIDAGDPDSPLDPDDTIADIGAFYFDQNVRVTEREFADQPTHWTLLPAWPNPFNASTTVSVVLPHPAQLTVDVFNIAGQRIATLASSEYNSGSHRLSFDASHLAAGVYFVRASAHGWSVTQKVLLVR